MAVMKKQKILSNGKWIDMKYS